MSGIRDSFFQSFDRYGPVPFVSAIAALILGAAALGLYITEIRPEGDSSAAPGDRDDTGDGLPSDGGSYVIDGVLYTRQDLVEPGMGSAFGFDPDSEMATYYHLWTPGTCEVEKEPGSRSVPYTYEDDILTMGPMSVRVSDDGRTFFVDEPGMWSGESVEGVQGPNLVLINGMNGTYTATDCPAP